MPRTRRGVLTLAAILTVGAGLRLYHLGRLSLWYDEVVPMRLARQPTVAGLFRLLFEIEATRAPAQPLALQFWLRAFGPSDVSGRLLAAICGLLTIPVVERIGRRLYDGSTGLWGAWLCAVSPLLVAYSQEVKMYSWLVLWTCLAWDLLFSLRESAPWWRASAFGLTQAILFYSHPLGLLMIGAQGLAYLATRRAFVLPWSRWVAIEAGLIVLTAPWVRHYLDHPPEYVLPRLSIKYLLGTPIGFIGGDFRVLFVFVGLISVGLVSRVRHEGEGRRIRLGRPGSSVPLLIWFVVPPLLLYLYSRISHPIFGPARYTLFVGPAYLLLVARGLVKVPRYARYFLAMVGAVLALTLLGGTAYSPDLKADWRAAAAEIRRFHDRRPVVVLSADPTRNVEVETARYYLEPTNEAITAEEAVEAFGRRPPPAAWIAYGIKDRRPVGAIPEPLRRHFVGRESVRLDVPGLRLDSRRLRPIP